MSWLKFLHGRSPRPASERQRLRFEALEDRLVPAAPLVGSIFKPATPADAATVDFEVTFDQSVSGVDASDFALVTTGAVSGASITNVSPTGSATVFTVTVNTGTGDGTVRLNLLDDDSIVNGTGEPLGGAGAGNGGLAGPAHVVDKAPTIVSIVRADADPTNAASVNFTVTFSEDVSGVDVGDFGLTAAGLLGVSFTGVSPAGAATDFTVTVNTGTGDGTLRLDFHDDDSVTDGAGNVLSGPGQSALLGEEYTIDKLLPVVDLSAPSATATGSGPVTYTVTYSDIHDPLSITLSPADVILNATGTASGVVQVSGSGNSRTITIASITGDGTLGISLAANTATDTAGNPAPAAGPSDTFAVDNPDPPDPVPVPSPNARFAVGAGSGSSQVTTFDARTAAPVRGFLAFPGFAGGVAVAVADVNNDGTPDTVVGTARGAAHVKVFDGASGAELYSFFAFEGFSGGVTVAARDLDGDGKAEVIVGAATGSSHVKTFSGTDGSLVRSFFAFDGFGGGVSVAAGDIDHDGREDIVAGTASGSSHVKAFRGTDLAELASFFAFEGFPGGVNVAAGDIDSDGRAEVIAGTATGSSHVKAFDGATGTAVRSFFAFPGFNGGVRVGAVDRDGDGADDIIVGTASGPGAGVIFRGTDLAALDSFTAAGVLAGGVFVGPV